MARTWLSIRVELVSGRGRELWPRPGRIFAASRSHTFAQLAEAIDDAFARWDRSHLHEFTLAGDLHIGLADVMDYSDVEILDYRTERLSRLNLGEQFAYVFDLGDDWDHLCTVASERIDPAQTVGVVPDRPLPYWGWGVIPDQYDRDWDGDDGEADVPEMPVPPLSDLPPLRPWWGPRDRFDSGDG